MQHIPDSAVSSLSMVNINLDPMLSFLSLTGLVSLSLENEILNKINAIQLFQIIIELIRRSYPVHLNVHLKYFGCSIIF